MSGIADAVAAMAKAAAALVVVQFLTCSYFAAASCDVAPKFWEYTIEVKPSSPEGETE